MKLRVVLLLVITGMISILSCRKPFAPVIVGGVPNYLVVDGVINSGPDSTYIKLSRTTRLGNHIKAAPEAGALVTVEGETGDNYTLTEDPKIPGVYVYNGLNLPANKKYHLHIVTSNGRNYLSDFTPNKLTPDIDSISYTYQKNGVQFFVNTHDNTNNTRYYRWDYEETWSYFSVLNSQIDYKNHQVVVRRADSLVNACYRHATPSNSIFVGTSNKLAKDVISLHALGYVDAATGKISHVYSLLVKQYAISPEAYNFWEALKKNTEQLGSVFDAQPSTSRGNIHCTTDANEPVIGYISVSTIKTKRIFISGRDLPFYVPSYVGPPDKGDCGGGVILLEPAYTLQQRLDFSLASRDSTLVAYVEDLATFKLIGYSYPATPCVDCRVLGGTNIKPSYWPY
ncbi:hypothetical protein BH09BAC6_BH09BAC6_23380 [soil metagenome]|jgi:hypothetical protein